MALTRATGKQVTLKQTGGVVRNLQSKMDEMVSVLDFGAVGDGVTDDTTAIQAALDSGAGIITGNMVGTYVVTTLTIPSNTIFRDIKLLAKPQASVISMLPVISVGGVPASPVSDIILDNIIVNGNRQNMADITFSNGEDGGMHGFRVGVESTNIKIINCEANYCGTAGIVLTGSDFAAATDPEYTISNIYINNFKAHYNREHGIFLDSCEFVFIEGFDGRYNGLDLIGALGGTDGLSGARASGDLFGKGFTIETYVGFPTTYVKDIYVSNLIAVGNAFSCSIYAPNAVTENAAVPVKNVFLNNVDLGYGDYASGTSGDWSGFYMLGNSNVGSNYGIENIHLSGNIQGHIDTNYVKQLIAADGFITPLAGIGYKGKINNGLNCVVTAPSTVDNILIETLGSDTVTTLSGAGTLSTGVFSTAVKAVDTHIVESSLTVTGGTIAGGNMSWQIDLPTTIKAVSCSINCWNTVSGKSVVANVRVVDTTELTIFMEPTDDTINGLLEITALL